MRPLPEFIEFLNQNPISYDEDIKILNNNAPLVGDRDEYVIFLTSDFEACDIENFEFRLVMSIETSPSKSGSTKYKCRRMSLCCRSGIYNINRIVELCYILGFTGDCNLWMYKFVETPIHNIDISQLLETIIY